MKNITQHTAGVSTVTRLFSTALLFLALGSGSIYAQTFTESMGSVSGTTSIASHESANGFDNIAFTMSGTADVRNTDASTGYTGASGNANVFFTGTTATSFQIAGISTNGIACPVLSFGIFKGRNASDASEFIVEVSSDGVNYTQLSYSALPTGSLTSHWYLRTASGSIPQTGNLRVRFTNTNTDLVLDSTTFYRIDDVTLTAGSGCRMAAPASFNPLVVSAAAYPNPFNGSVSITFNVPAAGEAQVVVKDMTGRVVEVLHNGSLAEGQHVINWTPSAEMSNGIYFCEVTAGGERQVLRLVRQE